MANDAMNVMQIYKRVEMLLKKPWPEPCTYNVKEDATEAYDHLRCHYFIPEAEELVCLLLKPHMKALLETHDTIGNRLYEPVLPPVVDGLENVPEFNPVQLIRLVKQNEPLGATIKAHERTGAILVARIMHGGAAARCGCLSVGDEILEINAIPVRGRDPLDVIHLLSSSAGEVRLKVVPAMAKGGSADHNSTFVRTQFNFDPLTDNLIPCREAGLAFHVGDILRLVNTEDPHWWQAVRLDPHHATRAVALGDGPKTATGAAGATVGLGRAGLVPSKALQEKKEQFRLSSAQGATKSKEALSPTASSFLSSLSLPFCSARNIKGALHFPGQTVLIGDQQTAATTTIGSSEILTYEEVETYLADESHPRPIVLIGPPLIGKRELIRQLINTDTEHFREPIRLTTRPTMQGEVHGRDFFFVTTEEFETFQRADSLIDQYECGGYHYGLCIDTVMEIIQAKQVPVFAVRPQSLQPPMRLSLVKPYVVYLKPPPLDVLLETRILAPTEDSNTNARLSLAAELSLAQHYRNRGEDVEFTETWLHQMLQSAHSLELQWNHRIDRTLVNDDLPFALEQLSELAYRLETESFWVPKHWLSDDFSSSSISTGSTA